MLPSRLPRRYAQLHARRLRKAARTAAAGAPPVPLPPTAAPEAPAKRPGLAWRLVPLRGRFLAPFTRLVLAALPNPPETFTSADVVRACKEAERVIGKEPPCNPAEVIDLLVSRGIVHWTPDGFQKRKQTRLKA